MGGLVGVSEDLAVYGRDALYAQRDTGTDFVSSLMMLGIVLHPLPTAVISVAYVRSKWKNKIPR